MEALVKVKKAVVGLSLLTLAIGIGCGKKGGGGAVVTPPSESECSDDGDNCEYGHNYAHGDFLAKGIGKARYGSNRTVTLKLAFYAKDSFDENDDDYNYNGDVIAVGGLFVREGDDYANIGKGVLRLSQREIAGINWSIDIGVNLGGNKQVYYDDWYVSQPIYVEPIVYRPTGCNHNSGCHTNCNSGCSYHNPRPCNSGNNYCNTSCNSGNNYCNSGCNAGNNYCNGDYDNGDDYTDSDCRLPKGDYSVRTLEDTRGQWDHYNNRYARVTNLKLVIKGNDREARATLSGYVDSNRNDDDRSYKLTGYLTLTKINGKTCSTRVNFQ